MDYKEKYEMALETIQEILDSGSDSIKMSRLRLRLQSVFPEIRESKDEKIRKEIIKFLELPHPQFVGKRHQEDWLAWLEKQGEQKHFSDFNANDWYVSKVDGKIHNMTYNPTDNIEPKFHAGDWITNGDYIWKIIDVKPLDYILQSQDGNIVDDTISHIDEQFNLWTIKDAKEGDILNSPSHHLIWIYKDKKHYHACVNMNYVTDNFFINGLIIVPNDVCPATKNEKNILFASMIEAGYEWNAEKKELKKNNSYCQEHCKGYQETGKCFADGDCKDKREAERKSTWSEEDERMCQETIDWFEKKCFPYALESENPARESIKWLKSLKTRYTWKPSDEQIEALDSATENCAYSEYQVCLRELMGQLKKLKE